VILFTPGSAHRDGLPADRMRQDLSAISHVLAPSPQ